MKILFIIIFIFIVLLMLPVYINISFKEKLLLKIKYLFISFRPFSKEKNDEAKIENKENTVIQKDEDDEEASYKIKELIKETGLDGFLSLLSEISNLSKDLIKTIMGHTVIKDFNLKISVSDEDSSKTALYYAGVCSTVYPSVSIIINAVRKYKKYNVSIMPDFKSNKSEVDFSAYLRIRLLFLISGSIVALLKSIKIILKIRKKSF